MKLVSQLLCGLPHGARILEVGCGNGNVLRFLERAAAGKNPVVGMDYFGEGLEFARRRTTCPLIRGDLRSPPFEHPFHLVGMFDVLEHIPDDGEALEHLRETMEPDGILMLTVPADPALWSVFDEASGHCRRYTTDSLRRAAEAAGFRVERLTPFMASIYPLVRLKRGMTQGRRVTAEQAVAEELKIVPVLNGLLYRMLAAEGEWLTSGHSLPFGSSLMAVLRKRA
jgi:SAM-dependent methyltransferase